MSEYRYEVVMETPLGPKRGSLCLQVAGTQIRGVMTMLGRRESVCGECIGEKNCRLHGRMITRMRAVDYTAEGTFDSSHIALTVQEARNTFIVRGTASGGERRMCR